MPDKKEKKCFLRTRDEIDKVKEYILDGTIDDQLQGDFKSRFVKRCENFFVQDDHLYLTNETDREQSRLVLPTDDLQVQELQAKLLHIDNCHEV